MANKIFICRKGHSPGGGVKASRVTKPRATVKKGKFAESQVANSAIQKPAYPLTQHEFPLSNVRASPEEPPTIWSPIVRSLSQSATCSSSTASPSRSSRRSSGRKSTKINGKLYREEKDHLVVPPKPKHRYLSASGKILFDQRYAMVSQRADRQLRSNSDEGNEPAPGPLMVQEPPRQANGFEQATQSCPSVERP
ncbi:hypothetical protein XA68_15938 [Ophiocordyceps unilateralis]|uniref:Uncharacterized protein n=1 Tax=Ophiocordyceps unilateralis TaxID=268505 RepID=A0A2A9P7I2_OPHUN|nr:hypothetical protein XA68_15938 [Ophiocordyceps unilateralis]